MKMSKAVRGVLAVSFCLLTSLALTGCGGGGGDDSGGGVPPPAVLNVAGTWYCAAHNETLIIQQNGNALTVTQPGSSVVFTGAMDGSAINLSDASGNNAITGTVNGNAMHCTQRSSGMIMTMDFVRQ